MLGQLKEQDGRWQLRFTRKLHHPPEKVWRALVEPEHLEAWFPTTMEGDRAQGAELEFSFRENEAPPMHGELIAHEPHRCSSSGGARTFSGSNCKPMGTAPY